MTDIAKDGYRVGVSITSDAIFFVNHLGEITYFNSSALDLVGEENGVIGRPLWAILETSVENSKVLVERALHSSGSNIDDNRFVATVYRPDGERRAVLVTLDRAYPVADHPKGECCALVAAVQDVTESFLARQALVRAKQAQKLEAIGQLVGGVAHELNNPLSAVIAYAQLMLSSSSLPEDDIQSLETILSEARRAAKIVSNVLTFSRQHRSQRTYASVNKVVEDTLALRRYALVGLNIVVLTSLDESIPSVWMDHFQIQQVLLNLINNAEQAMQDWSGERQLKVGTYKTDAHVYIYVSDTGPGIDPSIRKEIFNPFFTTKDVEKGTGLGLAISDGIVKSHGGRIAVDTSDSGATFSIELPLPNLEDMSNGADTEDNLLNKAT